MKDKYNKIAKVISKWLKGRYSRPFDGAYYHDSNGSVVATDGRRIVVFPHEEKIDSPKFINHDGKEVLDKSYPNYKMYLTPPNKMMLGEWTIDLGKIIMENDLLNFKERVAFKTTFVHYNKDGHSVAKEEEVVLDVFNATFIADILRCYRAYNGNRTKSMVVKISFYDDFSPCYIETMDGKMLYIVQSLCTNKYVAPTVETKVIYLENRKVF